MFAALYAGVDAGVDAGAVPTPALRDIARAFTPRFEQIPPHDAKSASWGPRLGTVVLLDASGLSRLFGTAQELGEHLRDAIGEGRVAMASTPTAAMLLALGAPGLTVVRPGAEAIALAPLSLDVLDAFEKLSEGAQGAQGAQGARGARGARGAQRATVQGADSTGGWHHPRSTHHASRKPRCAPENRLLEIFTKWGIRTLGALQALSGPEIHERLGDRGARWQSLARGIDARPLVPWVDEVPFEATLDLEWPIDGLEPLSFVLARLLEPLSERLERADRGAATLFTSLRLTSRAVFTRTLPLPAPMRDPKTLRTLILLDLESHPPDAPIDTVRVCIEPTPAKVLQWTLLDRAQPAVEQVTTLTARLTALMGEGHVGAPVLVDTWRPGAFALGDVKSQIGDCVASADCPSTMNREIDSQHSPHSHQSAIAKVTCALRRFRCPIPARVMVNEGKPVRVQLDRHGFTSGAVVQAAGPWRTSGEWWDLAASWDRDEWDVGMSDGTVYRLVVERGVGQWCVEGVID